MKFSDKVYGEIDIVDPIAIEIIETEYFQRLKYINQYGGIDYAFPGKYTTTRFEHSVGVYYLLKQLGADFETQIAGLLHDSGHAPLSHLLERVEEWKDFEHTSFLAWAGGEKVRNILSRAKIELNDFSKYPLLKQKLPEIGADRIDYGVRDYITACGEMEGFGKEIMKSLKIIENKIVFTELAVARKFANLAFSSLDLIVHSDSLAAYYGAFQNIYEKAYQNNILTSEKILGEIIVDQDIVDLMNENSEIYQFELEVLNHKYSFEKVDVGENYDISRTVDKLRLFDPSVLVDGEVVTLSEVSEDFAKFLKQQEQYFSERMANYYKIVK